MRHKDPAQKKNIRRRNDHRSTKQEWEPRRYPGHRDELVQEKKPVELCHEVVITDYSNSGINHTQVAKYAIVTYVTHSAELLLGKENKV